MAAASSRAAASLDPVRIGLASGWKVVDASTLSQHLTLEADVVIVGTGAGGGTAAEILSDAGLNVVLVEEGPLATSSDFHMREAEAYSQLYQESSARKTKDKAINILQGRCVGGGTTVNWTSSFRTPAATLEHWAREFDIRGFSAADLAPWFARMEQRLGVSPWLVAANENNSALRGGTDPTARKITVHASTFIVSAGAIGSPALLIRSKAPDPHGTVGKRTFLHPTVVSAALMPDRVDGFAGAPQTIYSDHYLELSPDGPLGYKLEAPPLHPILVATTLPGHGVAHANWMRELAHMHVLIALMRDGFHARSPGGSVGLESDGSPVLDYRLDEFFWDGARRAFTSMAEIQFAAGAKTVMPLHSTAASYSSWPAAKAGIAELALEPLQASVVSAHVMGGCPLGPDPKRAVTDPSGRHHHLENLYVFDGSLFPTSVGANPQLSIYGITAKLATELAARLTPRRLG